jgi:hypothetical protein
LRGHLKRAALEPVSFFSAAVGMRTCPRCVPNTSPQSCCPSPAHRPGRCWDCSKFQTKELYIRADRRRGAVAQPGSRLVGGQDVGGGDEGGNRRSVGWGARRPRRGADPDAAKSGPRRRAGLRDGVPDPQRRRVRPGRRRTSLRGVPGSSFAPRTTSFRIGPSRCSRRGRTSSRGSDGTSSRSVNPHWSAIWEDDAVFRILCHDMGLAADALAALLALHGN